MRRTTVTAIALLLIPTAAFGCLWDYDTIKMERTRFPGTLELITGKFLRHSPEFYEWRIANRLKRLKSEPNNANLRDDLAVAYDKTGKHGKAIETALETEKLHPGRYETASNLATFYFHAGKIGEGVPHVDRALAINPDAHFGREKYQKLLMEYVIKRSKGGPMKLPLADVQLHSPKIPDQPTGYEVTASETFADFLRPAGSVESSPEAHISAVKAVQGMMKFAQHDSPVLLETLAALLTQSAGRSTDDAKLLAARAYLKASYEGPEGSVRTMYRGLAAHALLWQAPRDRKTEQATVESIESDFQRELEEGRTWYADLRERELAWIRDGKDPEAEFDKLYEIEPEVSGMDVKDPMTDDEKIRIAGIIAGTLCLLFVVASIIGTILLIRRMRRRHLARSLPAIQTPPLQ